MERAIKWSILAVILTNGLTRVVLAKVHPYPGRGDSLAATAADNMCEACNAVLAIP